MSKAVCHFAISLADAAPGYYGYAPGYYDYAPGFGIWIIGW
jgi:hypothetical protein